MPQQQLAPVSDLAQFSQRNHPIKTAVNDNTIEFFLGACATSRVFFEAAKGHVQSGLFAQGTETIYLLVWDAICESVERYHGCTYEILLTLVSNRLNAGGVYLANEQFSSLVQADQNGLLYSLFLFDPSALHLDFARNCLREFLYERKIVWPLRRVMGQSIVGHPTCLEEVVSEVGSQTREIKSIGVMPSAVMAIPRGSVMESPVIGHPTGVDYVDRYIGATRDGVRVGGNIEGDVVGLLGPIGGGKTTMLAQILVMSAWAAYTYAVAMGQPIRRSMFVSLEEPAKDLWSRVMSCAAKIPRRKLEALGGPGGWDRLSSLETLEPYELAMWSDKSEVICERDRYDQACYWLPQALSVLDLSGCGEFTQSGLGGVAEIADLVTREAEIHRQPVGCVGIDYAGLQCKRIMTKFNKSDAWLRHALSQYANECRSMIAVPHKATTWVLHQLKPDVMKYKPTRLIQWDEASECRTFAENMQVCGCLGAEDTSTGCRRLNWSKMRRVAASGLIMPTLKMHPDFAFLYDASTYYVPDEQTGRFVDPNTVDRFGGADQARVRGRHPNDKIPEGSF